MDLLWSSLRKVFVFPAKTSCHSLRSCSLLFYDSFYDGQCWSDIIAIPILGIRVCAYEGEWTLKELLEHCYVVYLLYNHLQSDRAVESVDCLRRWASQIRSNHGYCEGDKTGRLLLIKQRFGHTLSLLCSRAVCPVRHLCTSSQGDFYRPLEEEARRN